MGRSGISGGGGRSSSGGGRSSGGFSGSGRSGGMRSSGRSSFSSSSSSRSSSSMRSSMGRSSGGFGSSSRPSAPKPASKPRSMTPPPVRHVAPPPPRPVAPPPIYRPRVVIPPMHHTTVVYNSDTVYENEKREKKRSTRKTVMWCIIAFLCAFGFIWLFSNSDSSNITKSTVAREKLVADVSLNAGYYTDEANWIIHESELTSGLKHFYEKTGVAPYVYIVNEINGNYDPTTEELEAFAEEAYAELFDDEAHLLLLFWDYEGSWEYTTWLGSQTGVVMDAEARDILFDYIDYYYYAADTDEGFFSNAFRDAADRIMNKSTSPFVIIAVIGGAVAIIFIGFKWYEKKKEADEKKAEYNKEILNTPLEKMADDLSDLEEKYKE